MVRARKGVPTGGIGTCIFATYDEKWALDIVYFDRTSSDTSVMKQSSGLTCWTLDPSPCDGQRVPVQKAVARELDIVGREETKVGWGIRKPEGLHDRVEGRKVLVFFGYLRQGIQVHFEHLFYAWPASSDGVRGGKGREQQR